MFQWVQKMVILDKLTADSFHQQPLLNNKYSQYQGKTVCFTRWIKSIVFYVKDIFNENGLKPIDDIGRILQNKQNWLWEYRILHNVKYTSSYKYTLFLFTASILSTSGGSEPWTNWKSQKFLRVDCINEDDFFKQSLPIL